ncbi:ornithine carbamoyltransferase [Bacillota bacterium]
MTLKDYTPEEIRYLLDLAHDLKSKKRAGICGSMLKSKHIVLLFEKTSTRTRCAFEVACADEGGHVTFLDSKSSQMNIKESMEDSAKVLGRFFDGIEYRGYDQELVECLAKHSGIPVWNGLTNVDHPTQILADLMTLEEHAKKPLNELKVVFCGDIRNNMSYAWMYGCAKMGMHYVAFGPEELKVDEEVLATAQMIADQTGGKIEVSHTDECLKGADAIYTDVWASMGEEDLIPERAKMLAPYKVTMDMIKATGNPDILFMHCLPSFHDFETQTAKEWMAKGIDIREVTDEVFRSRYSIVFSETENRMHTAKAILIATM